MSDATEDVKPEHKKTLKDLHKAIVDFTRDILTTFPEEKKNISKELREIIEKEYVLNDTMNCILVQCKSVYMERFFDILYQNKDIYDQHIFFLPGIDFHRVWNDSSLSDNSREMIWKYIQLIVLTLVSLTDNSSDYGAASKLFENINDEEFNKKIKETIDKMQEVFTKPQGDSDSSNDNKPNISLEDLPKPEDIREHLHGMMNGKLGNLAREIAQETAADLAADMGNPESLNDVFKTLMQNPTKMMGLIKKVGDKLDTKMKEGAMKESDMLSEASDILQKMKSMPGMGDIQSMLARMGMGHMMPGGSKINVDAMQSSLNSKIKTSKERDRLLCVLEQRNAQKSAALSQKETAISANATISGGDNKETQDLPQQSKKKKKHVKRL
jgi:hypothetical protein